ncbi:unnamed protein product [Parnassius apollo]|uniref:(apollo) hypothetical protein n=1 Tax=Parnassius apollo TaxID=110799 RepID=A0A8S3XJC4_PARAO|nr:unnamed protein product [Parnassius apollo]
MPGGVRTRGGRVGRRGRGVCTRGGTQQRPHVSDDVIIGVVEELPTGSPLVVPAGTTHRGRGVRTRGGTQQRPQVSDDIHLGLIEELTAGSPLEMPLHPPKRRRYLPHTAGARTSGIWQPTATDMGGDDARGDVAGGNDTGGDDADIQGGFQYVECSSPFTPHARVLHGHHRRLLDSEIGDILNYGSEDEEDSEEREGDDNSELTLPRSLRMFFEPEDDTLEEAKAAGHIDVLQFHPTPEPSQVDPGVVEKGGKGRKKKLNVPAVKIISAEDIQIQAGTSREPEHSIKNKKAKTPKRKPKKNIKDSSSETDDEGEIQYASDSTINLSDEFIAIESAAAAVDIPNATQFIPKPDDYVLVEYEGEQ